MQEIAIKNGAEVSDQVTPTTTLLVVGSKAGRKLETALANDIPVISDQEFMKMLNLAEPMTEHGLTPGEIRGVD